MTLLETLIAMALLSTLMVFIFGIFRELVFIQDQDKQSYQQAFYDEYSKARLNQVFSNLKREPEHDLQARKMYFFTDQNESISTSPSLVFTYNNGVRHSPYFSGDLLGRLYVDSDKDELRLVSWPVNTAQPQNYAFQEILLKGVEKISFEFLTVDEEQKRQTGFKVAEISKRGEWQNEWDIGYKELPVIMKIHLKMKDQPEERLYTFALPVYRFVVHLKQ